MKYPITCILIILLLNSTLYASDTLTEHQDSTIQLNEIVVDAYRINTRLQKIPGNIAVLTANETSLSDGNNFTPALHSTPGIYMHSGTYGTSRIVIRGVGSRTPYNTNRIKSYLNDIPITTSDGISTPEDIDLLSIQRIEIVKGPASALYGSGMGGNINLYTPSEKEKSAKGSIQYGSFNTMKVGASGIVNSRNFNLFGSLNHLTSDGYRENNHFIRTSAISSGRWTLPHYSLEYTLLLMNVNAGLPSSIGKTLYNTHPQAAAVQWNLIKGYKKLSKAIGGITLAKKITPNLSNRFTVFTRWIDSYEKRPFNNLDDGTFSIGWREKLSFHSEKWDFAAGAEFVNDTYNWQLDKNNALINKNSENRNQLNIFGIAYFRPSEKWNISAGSALNKVNYSLTDQFAENSDQSGTRNFPFIFSPRLGINYTPTPQIALYSSVGSGFSMPSPEETLLPEGKINQAIQPEQGIQAEVGVRLNLYDSNTQLDLAVYQIDLTNLLVTKRLTEDIFTGINAGKTRHRGFELMLKQNLLQLQSFPGNLNLTTSYTYSDNRFIDFTDGGISYNDNSLPGIPSHLAQSTFNWNPAKSLHVQTTFHYVGSQYMNDANTEKSDGYFTIQLKTAYRFSLKKIENIEIYGGVNNLTDARYASMISVNALSVGGNEPRYYYPGLPRHFFAGLRFNFN